MATIIISGYATMDYVVHADGAFDGSGTMTMRTAGDADWPRPGGAVLYAGRQLAAAGHRVVPVTWVGADADGTLLRSAMEAAGLETGAIAVQPGGDTTRCLLIYQRDGGHGCLIRPGPASLPPPQDAAVIGADLLVVTAGPVAATKNLLATIPPAARVAWIVKPDPACFPPDLAATLARRADWLFCNQGERAWLDRHRPTVPDTQILFETQGAAGVVVTVGAGSTRLPTRPLAVTDATGAGDSFAGAVLAGLLAGDAPAAAAACGMAAAARLLRRRL